MSDKIEIHGKYQDLTAPQFEAIRHAITRYLNGEAADEVIEAPIAKRCDYFHKDQLAWDFADSDSNRYRCIFPQRHTPGRLEGTLVHYVNKDELAQVSWIAFRPSK